MLTPLIVIRAMSSPRSMWFARNGGGASGGRRRRGGSEDRSDEVERRREILLERRLDLVGRQDEPALVVRVGPQLDGDRRDLVPAVGPVRRIAGRRIELRR